MASKKRKNKISNAQTKSNQIDQEIEDLLRSYESIEQIEIKEFKDLPLSQKTLSGLDSCKYFQPTSIQSASIGLALRGKDILAAAKTGSGKTLAFLIPVLERLYVKKWNRMDGIGAIIISPTRELAYQIFETLRKVGRFHDFSAGLIIGGKNLHFEKTRMDQCNILICTPGRLLQHMDENPLFDASTMQILVLDEADRCLDMGFETTLNAIIENFPPERQTLLFSATQTNSIKDLARLNLCDPISVGIDLNSKSTTKVAPITVPEQLKQSYIVVDAQDKITVLWSFIKNHLKQKIIVFLTSCKQVKYIYEIFCKLRPGTSLLALYGTLHQDRRLAIYNDFMRKTNVVLFATDIASRGLDFPSINWVLQLDSPENVTQYIHRAGRSARYKARGESLLVLTPSEEKPMIEDLEKNFITIPKLYIDPKKLFSPRAKIEAFLARNTELKASAKRAFVAYVKSIFLMKNKRVFNVKALDLDAFAKSLGLVVTPRVRFLKKASQRESGTKQNNSIGFNADVSDNSDDSDGDDFLKVKRKDHEIQNSEDLEELEKNDIETLASKKKAKPATKTAMAKKALKKKLQVNEIRKFDESGNEVLDKRKHMLALQEVDEDFLENDQDEHNGGIDLEKTKKLLSIEDKYDKERFRELVKIRHKKQKLKIKQKLQKAEEHEDEDDDDDDDEDGDSGAENESDYSDGNYSESSRESEESEILNGANGAQGNMEDESNEPARKKSKIASKLSLNEAEAIAAELLSLSRN